jgi:hypothetical protein|tara:strand:- start:5607 stop:5984 length:378 start_codon:yes stop_codon:yes gene_type:complete
MSQFKNIYFIYDADGGMLNEIKYWINKNILKKDSACELCDISHGKLFVRMEWLKFIKELKTKYKVEVLHRNELPRKIQENNFQLPCVIGETDQGLKEIFNKTAFKDLENLKNVKELRAKFFEKVL